MWEKGKRLRPFVYHIPVIFCCCCCYCYCDCCLPSSGLKRFWRGISYSGFYWQTRKKKKRKCQQGYMSTLFRKREGVRARERDFSSPASCSHPLVLTLTSRSSFALEKNDREAVNCLCAFATSLGGLWHTLFLGGFTANCCKLGAKSYSQYFRLSDLHQVYGGNGKDTQSNTTEENNKATSRYGKTGDIYSLVSWGIFLF